MNNSNGAGGWIGGLLVLIGVIIALSLLAFIVAAIVYCVILYFTGRQLHRRTTTRYRLTWKSGLSLVALAIMAYLIAQALIPGSSSVESLPLAIPFFLIGAILLLDLWALTKRCSHLVRIGQKRRVEQRLSRELQRIEQAISRVNATRQNLEARYGSLWTQQSELEELINQLQLQNPRVFGVAAERWRRGVCPTKR
jgi:hypothetical protein